MLSAGNSEGIKMDKGGVKESGIMTSQSWIITGLVGGLLASILFVVSGAENEVKIVGIAFAFGTMTLITIIRKFARSRVI